MPQKPKTYTHTTTFTSSSPTNTLDNLNCGSKTKGRQINFVFIFLTFGLSFMTCLWHLHIFFSVVVVVVVFIHFFSTLIYIENAHTNGNILQASSTDISSNCMNLRVLLKYQDSRPDYTQTLFYTGHIFQFGIPLRPSPSSMIPIESRRKKITLLDFRFILYWLLGKPVLIFFISHQLNFYGQLNSITKNQALRFFTI